MHNPIFQSNSLDFSWKCEEETEKSISEWRQGNGTEEQKAAQPYSPGAAWRMYLHSEKMGRAFSVLMVTQAVEVSS